VLLRLLVTIAVVAIVSGAMCPTLPAAQFPPQARQSQQEKDMQDRQLKELNKKRQQDIRDDTTKLFQLASELKAAVDKSNENLLSLEVVRKADEVEKLAKRVKEKMKESVGPSPNAAPPPLMPTPHFP
jgi:type II secretory pathway pseudopilin PulG